MKLIYCEKCGTYLKDHTFFVDEKEYAFCPVCECDIEVQNVSNIS